MQVIAVKAVLVMVVLAFIALISVWTQQPFLAPSLAAAAFLQITTPRVEAAKVWNMAVGQLVGEAAGFVGVYAATASDAPLFMSHQPLVYIRVAAVVIATLLTVIGQSATKSTNAAGGTMAIILALGLETPTWTGLWRIAVGIAMVTLFGEIARRVILKMTEGQATGPDSPQAP